MRERQHRLDPHFGIDQTLRGPKAVRNEIQFEYDGDHDIVIARPVWHIATEEDCRTWRRQWVDYLEPFGRKVDCIMVLDDFRVDAEIAAIWGRYRAEINREYIRLSFRVHPDLRVRTFTLTSGIRYDAASAEAASVEAAVEGIIDARQKAGV
jgi:hypothetical protein